MTKKLPLVSIISINYNQVELTLEMLQSLALSNYKNFEVIIVDNASTTDPTEKIQGQNPAAKVIRSARNLGFSGGNNIGMHAASGDYFFFMNNDTELTPGLIGTLLDAFDRIPGIGIISPLICYSPRPEGFDEDVIQYAGSTPLSSLTARNETVGEKAIDLGQFSDAGPTAYAHGAAMMVPREVVEKVGMMPELFFLYYEELDWSEQIRNAGYKVYVEPKAKVYHKESITIGKKNPIKTHYLNRNRILFVRRNRSFINRLVFYFFLVLFTIPKNTIQFLIKGERNHLKAFFSAVKWHFGNGIYDENPVKLKELKKTEISKSKI